MNGLIIIDQRTTYQGSKIRNGGGGNGGSSLKVEKFLKDHAHLFNHISDVPECRSCGTRPVEMAGRLGHRFHCPRCHAESKPASDHSAAAEHWRQSNGGASSPDR